jgi:starvation-inducible DNA-binding protein
MAQPSTIAGQSAAIDVDRRLQVAEVLQELLTDLIDLSLQAKQAHWNIRGRSFRDLHLQLDELVDQVRERADEVAERCLALGVAADGRIATVASSSHLDAFPEGRVADHQVVDLIVERLHTVSEVGRSRLGELGDLDPVSQDLVDAVLADVEKQLWMFEAHRPADRG